MQKRMILELHWWLQVFWGKVEVLEPVQLRNKFKDVSRQLAATYDSNI